MKLDQLRAVVAGVRLPERVTSEITACDGEHRVHLRYERDGKRYTVAFAVCHTQASSLNAQCLAEGAAQQMREAIEAGLPA